MKILAILYAIHNPRFTTEEMESSKLKCGFHFEISSMYYDDLKKDLPSHAFGWVIPPVGKPIRAVWDRNGQCLVDQVRMLTYDLARPTQSEIDSYRAIGESFALAILTIIISLIF